MRSASSRKCSCQKAWGYNHKNIAQIWLPWQVCHCCAKSNIRGRLEFASEQTRKYKAFSNNLLWTDKSEITLFHVSCWHRQKKQLFRKTSYDLWIVVEIPWFDVAAVLTAMNSSLYQRKLEDNASPCGHEMKLTWKWTFWKDNRPHLLISA